jgi:hypothetical protein
METVDETRGTTGCTEQPETKLSLSDEAQLLPCTKSRAMGLPSWA